MPKLKIKSPHVDSFEPLIQNLVKRNEFNEVFKARVEKACVLLDADVPLYPMILPRTRMSKPWSIPTATGPRKNSRNSRTNSVWPAVSCPIAPLAR